MVGIILATHGEFAKGILQSANMVFGEQDNVAACTFLPGEGPEDIKNKIVTAINSFNNCDEILFLVDLWSGTPFNQSALLMAEHKDKWAMISGLNLPMLIEVLSARLDDSSAHEIASSVLATSREEIKVYPEELEKKSEKTTSSTTNEPKGKIPYGTVIGDGKIKYVLARVDTRLLHGQVATGWVKETKPNRIIVVSDTVSKDTLRKSMIEQVAPPGVKAHVVPVKKMAEVAKDTRFGNTKALLLFEKPSDALEAYNMGVKFDTLNVGSIAHANGKVFVTKVLSMDNEDISSLRKLMDFGVKMDVRKVPSDSPENIEHILEKAENELKNKN